MEQMFSKCGSFLTKLTLATWTFGAPHFFYLWIRNENLCISDVTKSFS